MIGAKRLIEALRAGAAEKLSDLNGTLDATLDNPPPIIAATKPRAKSNRIATMETVENLDGYHACR